MKKRKSLFRWHRLGMITILLCLLGLMAGCKQSSGNSIIYQSDSSRIFFVQKGVTLETTEGLVTLPWDAMVISNAEYFRLIGR
jgi:hypothetical protein